MFLTFYNFLDFFCFQFSKVFCSFRSFLAVYDLLSNFGGRELICKVRRGAWSWTFDTSPPKTMENNFFAFSSNFGARFFFQGEPKGKLKIFGENNSFSKSCLKSQKKRFFISFWSWALNARPQGLPHQSDPWLPAPKNRPKSVFQSF